MEVLRAVYKRYREASKDLKTAILNEFSRICRYNRKYAIRLLNGPPPDVPPTGKPQPRRRSRKYGSQVLDIVEAVWAAAGYPWSVRLKVILRDWMPWIRKRFKLTPAMEKKLLAISPRQIDRRLGKKKAQLKRRIYGRTKPGTLLKHHIPIKTDHWDVTAPGFTEIDLVSHSGNSADGTFLNSLNQTDILTAWTETRAVMGKGQHATCVALDEIRPELPFDLLAIDSDNGSEFINGHLLSYCQGDPKSGRRPIQFTRGRAYKKDDNAHVEQKNWTHVRKVMGYERYDSLQAQEAMNELYTGELRLMMNLFQPTIKLVGKVRVGSREVRRYDQPRTPLDRVISSGKGDPAKIAELKHLRQTLDPFELARSIDKKLDRIYALANRRLSPKTEAAKEAAVLLAKPVLSPAEQDILRRISVDFQIKSVRHIGHHGNA